MAINNPSASSATPVSIPNGGTASSTAAAARAALAAAGTGDANTFSANQVLSGTANTAPNQFVPTTAVPAGTLLTPAVMRQLWALGNFGLLIPFANAYGVVSTLVGSGGYSAFAGYGYSIYSGATSASSSFIGFTNQSFFSYPGSVNSKDISFSKPLGASFEIDNIYFVSSTAVAIVGIGKQAQTTGDLSVYGIAFKIEYASSITQTVKLQVHDGTTLTTTASLATITNNNNQIKTLLSFISDGAGNVYAYINGAYVGMTTGGPTTNSTGGFQRMFGEIANGVTASDAYIIFGKIATFVAF